MSEERFAKAEFVAWMGIVGNLGLALVKGFAGYIAGSRALIADAANSASDVLGSIAVLIGLKAAKKPPDEDHPYGHGKAEMIAAIIVSVLLFLVAFEIASGSFQALLAPPDPPLGIALWAILLSIVVKEIMYRYQTRLGDKLDSHALKVNALDHRSDVYASTAVLLGVGGSIAGDAIGLPWLAYLDPVVGILVSGLIVKMGYHMLKESIHYTMDHVLHEDEAEHLLNAVKSVPGVIVVDELRAREHGHYWIVDVKISVDPNISVMEGHGIAKAAKKQLLQLPKVEDALIHVNPYDPGYAYSVQKGDGDDTSRYFH